MRPCVTEDAVSHSMPAAQSELKGMGSVVSIHILLTTCKHVCDDRPMQFRLSCMMQVSTVIAVSVTQEKPKMVLTSFCCVHHLAYASWYPDFLQLGFLLMHPTLRLAYTASPALPPSYMKTRGPILVQQDTTVVQPV